MNSLKKLAGQAAVYGLSSIVGRLLNYLLVPLHTRVFAPEQFGVITEMYSYVAILLVILTYGFETSFFRFVQKTDKNSVYSTATLSVFLTSSAFLLICFAFSQNIANLIQYPNHSQYVVWFAAILAADALTSIPFAKLRQENKAFRFALIKLVNIGVNVVLNLFWLWLCPMLVKNGNTSEWLQWVYNDEIGVGYVFLANLFASLATLVLLLPSLMKAGLRFDLQLWKNMVRYSLPLMIGGLAGMTNEMFSRVSMKYQLPEDIAMHELGIFGACFKVSVLMNLFIQTFRFAADPFFFNQAKEKDARQTYALVMNYFVAACSIIFAGIQLFMPVVRNFIAPEYYEGLGVVPILLMASIFLGIYYNLSIWYKLNDKTSVGAWISIGGAAITVLLNYWWIPRYSYMGAAWATFACYFLMMAVCYALGQKNYFIPYNLKKVIGYPLAAFLVYQAALLIPDFGLFITLFIRSCLLILIILFIAYIEGFKKWLISPRIKR